MFEEVAACVELTRRATEKQYQNPLPDMDHNNSIREAGPQTASHTGTKLLGRLIFQIFQCLYWKEFILRWYPWASHNSNLWLNPIGITAALMVAGWIGSGCPLPPVRIWLLEFHIKSTSTLVVHVPRKGTPAPVVLVPRRITNTNRRVSSTLIVRAPRRAASTLVI